MSEARIYPSSQHSNSTSHKALVRLIRGGMRVRVRGRARVGVRRILRIYRPVSIAHFSPYFQLVYCCSLSLEPCSRSLSNRVNGPRTKT
eukprot:1392585-Amorphochlora_amoeboformis.AAC.1